MKAIVAMDPYRVIGCKGKIPWHYPADLRFFKTITENHVLIMGRTTFDSVGPLPNRFTYVLTNNAEKLDTGNQAREMYKAGAKNFRHCYVSGEMLRNMLWAFPYRTDDFWLCGGAAVYQEFLPLCSDIYVTHIAEDYEGDTYMPEFEAQFPHTKIVLETKDFSIVKYSKDDPAFLNAGKIKLMM